jgi:pimeloyl-ACP methyl ester carboxylesterase
VETRFTPSYRGGAGSPVLLLHGFTDTWRTWELVLGALERHHEVRVLTLPGHAGGPAIDGAISSATLADAVEAALDAAGVGRAHIAGNSLGGYVALQLAARGRAASVVAFAPAGGWRPGNDWADEMLRGFVATQAQVRLAAPYAPQLLASDAGRRRATQSITVNYAHIPPELIAHQMLGLAACRRVPEMVEYALRAGYPLDVAAIDCPVRVVWGTEDRLLPWSSGAVRYREDLLPHADWIVLDEVGHCPQLDVPAVAAQLILEFAAR